MKRTALPLIARSRRLRQQISQQHEQFTQPTWVILSDGVTQYLTPALNRAVRLTRMERLLNSRSSEQQRRKRKPRSLACFDALLLGLSSTALAQILDPNHQSFLKAPLTEMATVQNAH